MRPFIRGQPPGGRPGAVARPGPHYDDGATDTIMRLKKPGSSRQAATAMSDGVTTATIRVAIVDDDQGLREDLAGLIRRWPGLTLAGTQGAAEAALEELPGLKPDVVLMDINLPGMDGVECVRRLKPLLPRTQFMMLTVYEDNDRLFCSLLAGATGYLLKRASPAEIVQVIYDLHAGGSPMTPQIARRVVQHYQETRPADTARQLEELTDHQRVFLEQLAQGYRYKEIADNLGISMDAVRSYVRRIYEKLQVHSRTEAVVKYLGR